MRSTSEPAGFANLPAHREVKVRMGNALAEVSTRIACAQEKAQNFWTLEQPATSLMSLFALVAELMAKASSSLVVVDVCMYGAPWRKPTTLGAFVFRNLQAPKKVQWQALSYKPAR